MWWIRVIVVVSLINLVLWMLGWNPEGWSLEWWAKMILVGIAAFAIVGPSEDD